MINVSDACRKNIDERHQYKCKVKITLKSGIELILDETKILINSGFRFEEGTSSQGKFDIGCAIIGKFTLVINNATEEFGLYDFSNAMIVPYIGVEYIVEDYLDGGNFFDYTTGDNADGGSLIDYATGDNSDGGLADYKIEWIPKGVFSVDEAKYNGFSITLECLDNIAEFEKPYTLSSLSYPATLRQIWQDACSVCKLRTNTLRFTNDDYTVNQRPNVSNFREVISYVSQLACCYVKADQFGNIFMNWYDTDYLKEMDIDGGNFLNYKTGDNADGGNLIDYKTGDNVDGGTSTENTSRDKFYVNRINSNTINTDDIKITGVQISLNEKTKDKDGNEVSETAAYLYGEGTYVLGIENNLLYQEHRDFVLQNMAEKVLGIIFRPLNISFLGDPTIEAGDTGIVLDNKGNSYLTVATNISFSLGGFEKMTADAETLKENQATRSNVATKALQVLEKQIYERISDYDIAARNLNQLMSNALGFYSTKQVQDDGSTIEYLHDKPTLAESKTIWKMTADGFAVSRDGGKTFIAGMTSDGGIVATVLDSIGVRSEWINTQELDVSNNKSLFDPNTGAITTWTSQFSASLEAMQSTLSKKIEDANGNISLLQSSIQQTVESINLCVKKDNLISTINQSAEKISMSAVNINLTGYVTIKSLKEPNSTIIDGSNIALIGANAALYYKHSVNDNEKYGLMTKSGNQLRFGNMEIAQISLGASQKVYLGSPYPGNASVVVWRNGKEQEVATQAEIETKVVSLLTSSTIKMNSLSVSGQIGFFGKAPTSQQFVGYIGSNATLANVVESFNNLRNALRNYGLIGGI